MSIFDKILIFLFDCGLDCKDFSKESGFIDSYTVDPDFPCGNHVLYLAYDSNVYTEQSIITHRKFSTNPYVITTYTKIVDKTPYCIYKLYIPATLFKRVELGIYVDDDLKSELLKFWKDDVEIKHFVFNTHITKPDWFKCIPEATDIPLYSKAGMMLEKMWLNSITKKK
jgi:hypothetical protein